MDRLILSPAEVAGMLGITRARLRALTRAGAIGHVRLGLGTQRQRVGYTPAQVEDFIQDRSMPAAPGAEPDVGEGSAPKRGRVPAADRRKPRQTARPTPYDAREFATKLLQDALARGDVVEWKP
jgi:hypothetical protein